MAAARGGEEKGLAHQTLAARRVDVFDRRALVRAMAAARGGEEKGLAHQTLAARRVHP
jgi:hypothetical protein